MHQGSIPLAGYRRALKFAVPYWPSLVLVLLTGVAATLFGLAQPYISKLLIDEALLKRNFDKLLTVSGLMLAATLLNFALNTFSSYQYVKASAAILFDIRLALYRHLHTLSPRFWASSRMGDVVSRINNDVAEVQRVSADSLLSVLSNVVFLAGSAAIMASLNAKLFLLSVAVLPVCIWALRQFQARLAGRVRACVNRARRSATFCWRRCSASAWWWPAVRRSARRCVSARAIAASWMHCCACRSPISWPGAVPGVLLTVCTAALFLYGGSLVVEGRLSTGSLVAMMAYHARLLAPVQNLMGLYTNLVSGGVSLSRVWELFDTPAAVVEARDAAPLDVVRGEITVEDVAFSHTGVPVLERAFVPSAARNHLRHTRAQRNRQIDAGRPAGPLSRPDGGLDPPGWARSARTSPGRSAARDHAGGSIALPLPCNGA